MTGGNFSRGCASLPSCLQSTAASLDQAGRGGALHRGGDARWAFDFAACPRGRQHSLWLFVLPGWGLWLDLKVGWRFLQHRWF